MSVLPANTTGNPLGDLLKSLLNRPKIWLSNSFYPGMRIFSAICQKRVEEIIHHTKREAAEILKGMKHQELTAYQVANLVTWMPEQVVFKT